MERTTNRKKKLMHQDHRYVTCACAHVAAAHVKKVILPMQVKLVPDIGPNNSLAGLLIPHHMLETSFAARAIYIQTIKSSFTMIVKYQRVLSGTYFIDFFSDRWSMKIKLNQYLVSLFLVLSLTFWKCRVFYPMYFWVLPTFTTVEFYQMDSSYFFNQLWIRNS